jgi:hypothetical protein
MSICLYTLETCTYCAENEYSLLVRSLRLFFIRWSHVSVLVVVCDPLKLLFTTVLSLFRLLRVGLRNIANSRAPDCVVGFVQSAFRGSLRAQPVG